MKYFFDTEFIEHAGGVDLVSIGIVNEQGARLYNESIDFDPYLADEWVRENVFKKLHRDPFDAAIRVEAGGSGGVLATNKTIADRILKFVGDDKKPVFYAYYGAYDWVVFARLFGRLIDKPEHFPMYVMDIKQMMHERGLTKEWKREHCPDLEGAHNALEDALWNRDLFNAIMRWEKIELLQRVDTRQKAVMNIFENSGWLENKEMKYIMNQILESINHYGNLTYPPRRVNQNNMKEFVLQVKDITPMTRAEYNKLRGWELPSNENGDDAGYHLVYPNGHQNWFPEKQFNELYQEADVRKQYRNGQMTFGEATELAKLGFGVGRKGWNGANMFAYIVPENTYIPVTKIAKEYFGGKEVPYRAYWALKTAQNDIAMWAPSGSDSLAEDWCVAISCGIEPEVLDKIKIIY